MEERKTFNGVHRDEWTDGVTIPNLRKAANAKVKFHNGRVAYWTKEREKAEREFKKHGMKLVANPQFSITGDRVAAGQFSYTSNKVQTAEVDYELQAKWQACNAKVEQHKAKAREYRRWAIFFADKSCAYVGTESQAKIFDLTFADMEYFGLLGDDTTDTGGK